MATDLLAIAVETRTLRGQVLGAVRSAVVSGRLAPGARVNEAQLASDLGVSRGTLREAIRRLEQEGLLVTLSHRGTFVRELSTEEIAEVYGVRLALESYAAREASTQLTPAVRARGAALRAGAEAGYPGGLTVAPILRLAEWAEAYDRLFGAIAAALHDVPGLDLTAELITHRFTPKSKAVLQGWYPGSALEMDEAQRARKLTRFGSQKYVFAKEQMGEMRRAIEGSLVRHLPAARQLYWT